MVNYVPTEVPHGFKKTTEGWFVVERFSAVVPLLVYVCKPALKRSTTNASAARAENADKHFTFFTGLSAENCRSNARESVRCTDFSRLRRNQAPQIPTEVGATNASLSEGKRRRKFKMFIAL
jgi:hypothetical protein